MGDERGERQKELDILIYSKDTQLFLVLRLAIPALALPYPEHLGPACRTYALGCWFAILHSDALGILHFLFGTTFHTICLHS